MERTPYYLYLWLAYHVVFIMAFVVHRHRWLNTAGVYEQAKKLFTILGSCIVIYEVCIKWLLGWRIDNWWLEGLLVFFTFCLGHVVFIIGRADGLHDTFSRYRKQYVAFAAGYIVLFYARLVLAALSGFSYNARSGALFLPDVRTNDLYLFRHYYLSYSEGKGVVIDKKFFIFSKDLSDRRSLANSICGFGYFDFADKDTADPFPYVARNDSEIQLQLNAAHRRNGYVNIRMNGDSLEVTGYKYIFDSAATTLAYGPCGVYRVK